MIRKTIIPFRAAMALLALTSCAAAGAAQKADRWISAWGTAQQLAPMPPARIPPPRDGETRRTLPPPGPSPIPPTPSSVDDQTIRMIVRPTVGGRTFRLSFSNAAGGEPITIGRTGIAKSAGESRTADGTQRTVTFGGQPSVTIQPGAATVSDPVSLGVAALELLSVSIYLPTATTVNTVHPLGLRTTYIAKGERTGDAALADAATNRSYFWLTGLEVLAPESAGSIIAFGDSITDGFATTPNQGRAWPDLLAERLQQRPRSKHLSVVNMGISGNRVRRDGAGLAALARFDRDVLARPGVRWIVFLEGINDINTAAIPGMPASEAVTADQLIAAYSQFVDRAHLHGIKVMGATMTPTGGLWLATPETEELRQKVNAWIRTGGKFDALVDFDKIVRDPSQPGRLDSAFDPGDHVHPNDAGNAAMARAIDVEAFVRR